jgi:hypothetical protein
MKVNKNEFILTVLSVFAVVLSVWIFGPASKVSAQSLEGPGYPGPHVPTVSAPFHFPWDKMPTLPPQARPEVVPPPFNPNSFEPGPYNPGPVNTLKGR